jgi:Zn-dependent membrane protease YugP
VADGKMVLGFALVAYPAKYGASGIKSFIVNQEGVIYEKDLGEETALAAAAMTRFDPDPTWRKHEAPASN